MSDRLLTSHDSAKLPDRAHRLGLIWVNGISTIVVLGSFITVIIYIFYGKSKSYTEIRLVYSLLIFSLTSVSVMMFASKSEFKMNIGTGSLLLAGPGLAWIMVLYAFVHIFPEKSESAPAPDTPIVDPLALVNPMSLKGMAELAAETEKRAGWVGFTPWENEYFVYGDVFKDPKSRAYESLFASTYLANRSHAQLGDLTIFTLFVYLDKVTVKFQRIKGHANKNDPFIYFQSHGSTKSEKPKSLLLQIDGAAGRVASGEASDKVPEVLGKYTDKYTADVQTESVRLKSQEIDCLVVSDYPTSDSLTFGDFILVSPNRYADSGASKLSLSVFSLNREIRSAKAWQVRSPTLSTGDIPPFMFKELNDAPANNGERIRNEFALWMRILDKLSSKRGRNGANEEASDFLDALRSNMMSDLVNEGIANQSEDGKYITMLDHVLRESGFCWDAETQGDLLLCAFLWKTSEGGGSGGATNTR